MSKQHLSEMALLQMALKARAILLGPSTPPGT